MNKKILKLIKEMELTPAEFIKLIQETESKEFLKLIENTKTYKNFSFVDKIIFKLGKRRWIHKNK